MAKKLKIIQSQQNSIEQFKLLDEVSFNADERQIEMNLLMLYPDICYQEIKGFGGAFTESSALNYFSMDESNRSRIREAYFGTNGLRYNLGRTHIASCDFSLGNYSYVDENDHSLASFSIARDQQYLLPFIHECVAAAGGKLQLMASPWSPPAWMKDNQHLLYGGKLLVEHYANYANYLLKYLQAYQAEGLEIEYLTIQNEPKAVQRWESCIYTAQEEQIFIRDYLAPALVAAGLTATKIVIWDHNKERAFERTREILADPTLYPLVHGIGVHWYSGDHFENLRLCREFFPDKELMFTEGCVELSLGAPTNSGGNESVTVSQSPWEFGEKYAHDLIGNFNNGLSSYIDWNLLLDQNGGPNHVGNYCSAPIICDATQQSIRLQPSYYFIGHFSKFVPAGSRRIAHSSFTSQLESTAFITPDNQVVLVVLNQQHKAISCVLKDVATQQVAELTFAAKSITTIIY
jgi:glucosylceramidase